MIDSSCQGIFFQNNRLEAYFNFFGAANEEEVNEVNKRGFQAQCLKITGKSLIFTTLLRAKRATFANAKN